MTKQNKKKVKFAKRASLPIFGSIRGDLLLVLLGHSRDRLLFLFNLELVHPLLDEVLQRLPGLLDLLADAVLGALLGAYQQVRLHLLVLLALDLNPTPAL